ncbi:MAG: hypothetical protein AAGG48_07905 [Planctomycetota bacterium]
MNPDATNLARQALEQQLVPIETRARELESELSCVNEIRKKLLAAKAALLGKKSRGVRSVGKSCIKREHVFNAVLQLLEDNKPSLEKGVLRDLTKEKLSKSGLSLSGFGLRFLEVISDEAFDTSSDGQTISLNDETKS